MNSDKVRASMLCTKGVRRLAIASSNASGGSSAACTIPTTAALNAAAQHSLSGKRGALGEQLHAGTALFDPKTSTLIQKCHPYTGNSETSGDSKNVFLHCGDVLDRSPSAGGHPLAGSQGWNHQHPYIREWLHAG